LLGIFFFTAFLRVAFLHWILLLIFFPISILSVLRTLHTLF
jgi:hypothetical protein